jgi:hypothetical protein
MTKRSYTSKPRDARPEISFELDGVTFVAEGDLSPVDALEFARMAARGADSESAEGAAAVGHILLFTLGESTYHAFRRHCREHHADNQTLMGIIGDLLTSRGTVTTGTLTKDLETPDEQEEGRRGSWFTADTAGLPRCRPRPVRGAPGRRRP